MRRSSSRKVRCSSGAACARGAGPRSRAHTARQAEWQRTERIRSDEHERWLGYGKTRKRARFNALPDLSNQAIPGVYLEVTIAQVRRLLDWEEGDPWPHELGPEPEFQ